MPALLPKPKKSVTIDGQKLGLQFDLNSNESKKGVKMQFILDKPEMDIRIKQELTQKISAALQKRFGEHGLIISLDDRNPYENVIGFLVPLTSITELLFKILKGEK